MFRADAFPSRLRSEWLVTRLGALLAAAITICFLTGLVSHLHQHPLPWLPLPADPVWGYRLTQGLHVATGLATIPLFAVKLWSVYPNLFGWPPARTWIHGLERLSVALLAGATAFELITGVFNLAHLYLWSFLFPVAHYAMAWVVVGSVLLHVAVKWPAIVRGIRDRSRPGHDVTNRETGQPAPEGQLSRRALIAAALTGSVAITVVTIGQTLRPLGWAGLLAPRSPHDVPTGIPINRTAADAGVLAAAAAADYRLTVGGPAGRSFTYAELEAMTQVEVELPIACVEGWSATGVWGGVRLRDLLGVCGVPDGTTVRAVSLEQEGLYAAAEVAPAFAQHRDTLLALRLNGKPLSIDHGYPVRLVAPDRPGVLQTKWVSRVEVL
jgi:DMSO/TMAO reductase YedYZ molybdopterin-dependent catalytic subunit